MYFPKCIFPKCIFQTVFLKTVFFKAVSFQLCNPARGYLWGAKGEEGGISRQLVIVNLTPQLDIILQCTMTSVKNVFEKILFFLKFVIVHLTPQVDIIH